MVVPSGVAARPGGRSWRTGSGRARTRGLGSAGCKWSMSCRTGPTWPRRRGYCCTTPTPNWHRNIWSVPGTEFVFRDAKQHLGLHDCQARAQAKLHFHFNLVFSACFWMRLQARAARDDPRDRFSLYQVKCHNHEWEMYQRFEAWSAAGRNGTQSQAVDHGIPADHPWHWASPLATGLPGS